MIDDIQKIFPSENYGRRSGLDRRKISGSSTEEKRRIDTDRRSGI